MKQKVVLWELMGFAVTSLGGTILHFLYDWLDGALWIAPFSGVNESTWEHMKLLFWSMFLFSIVQSFFFKDRKDFWYVKLKGILLGLALIPIIFYTYNGTIGKSPSWFNIAIFFITTAIVYVYETKEFNKNKMKFISPKLAIPLLSAIALLFVAFTFKTPELEIFRDPVSGGYGI